MAVMAQFTGESACFGQRFRMVSLSLNLHLTWEVKFLVEVRGSSLAELMALGIQRSIGKSSSDWWYTYPSEKYMKVNWDDDIPNIWKNIKCSKPPTRVSKGGGSLTTEAVHVSLAA